MAMRRSRKLREQYNEQTNSMNFIPNKDLLIELLSSDENGSIPLVNFLENTQLYLGKINTLEQKIQELEAQIPKNIAEDISTINMKKISSYFPKKEEILDTKEEFENTIENNEESQNIIENIDDILMSNLEHMEKMTKKLLDK